MNYNYVIFGSTADYYKWGYSDISKRSDAVYLADPLENNELLRNLRRIHMSPKINTKLNLPLKKIWNRYLVSLKFPNNKPICFLFFAGSNFSAHIKYGFVEYLKGEYPGSKFAVFYQDLISLSRTVSLDDFRKHMDVICSFDYADCERYDMKYHGLVYSEISDQIVPLDVNSDIYFCGAAKNRIDKIHEAYYWFKEHNFKCDFHIITNDKILLNQNGTNEGIEYVTSYSYYENLRHIKSCRYMLEIMQQGGTGYTIRACEAIVFNKKLVSNNGFLRKAEFFNEDDIIIFDEAKNLSEKSFLNNHECKLILNKKNVSPIGLLEFVDGYL